MQILNLFLMLTVTQVLTLLEQPKSKEIEEAVAHESRLRMHTVATDEAPNEAAYNNWVAKSKSKIDLDSQAIFDSLIPFPLPTVDFTEGVFNELSKVFETNDRHIKVNFKNPDNEELFNPNMERIDAFMRNEGLEAAKNSINSVVVTDLPSDQLGEFPAPYSYIVYADQFKIANPNSDGSFTEFAWNTGIKQGKDIVIAYVDDVFYRLFLLNEEGEYRFLSESQHDLTKCPVVPFWSDIKDKRKGSLCKKGVLTSAVSRLDDLLWKEVGQGNNNLYSLYPSIWHYKEEGDYQHPEPDEEYNNEPILQDGLLFPKGTSRNLNKKIVNGAVFKLDMPREGESPLGDVMGFAVPPVPNMQWIQTDLENTRQIIWKRTVGFDGESNNDQAKNEKQVQSGFESQTAVFDRFRKNLEQLHAALLWNEACLMFGVDQVISVNANYGCGYFLHTSQQLEERYQKNKQSGIPFFMLIQERENILDVKYKNNPDLRSRMQIISHLDPYPTYSMMEAKENIDILDERLVRKKLNLENFINRFERTVLSIQSIANTALSMDEKVNFIDEELNKYLDETKPREPEEQIQGIDREAAS